MSWLIVAVALLLVVAPRFAGVLLAGLLAFVAAGPIPAAVVLLLGAALVAAIWSSDTGCKHETS